MPGPQQRRLTPAQAKKLDRAQERIEEAEQEWAEVVRSFGDGAYSAVSRHIGITPESVRKRVLKWLGPAEPPA